MRRVLASALAALALAACSGAARDAGVTLQVWAFGREGEVLGQLVPAFERDNPGVRVEVQQVPWRAAHEKLLTAFVGRKTPDVVPLGNTWIPEFAAIGALEPLAGFTREDFFEGLWATNLIDGQLYGVPWYADTRLLFYRTDLLEQAGYREPPKTWGAWVEAMRRIRARGPADRFGALLPLDEWQHPVVFGLEAGSDLLRDDGRFGDFSGPAFARGADFYMSLFRDGLAPIASNNQVANVYQQFERGDFAFYATGPWNIGEFRRRMSPGMEGKWSTAAMPAPDGQPYPGVSVAGGASLCVFKASAHKDAAFRFVRYLVAREQEIRFFELTGDLPPRESAWDAPGLANDPKAAAFRLQLAHVVPTPQVPEWENIAWQLADAMEAVARGKAPLPAELKALDAQVDRTLAKRRWILARREAPR